MAQKDKGLLLIDLCARLPYGVRGRVYAEVTKGEYDITGDMIFFNSPFDVTLDSINASTEEIHVVAIGNEETVYFLEEQQVEGTPYTINDFKPYLRPMSSMTEEEKKDYAKIVVKSQDCIYANNESATTMVNDWYLSKQFDVRGLIPMGLALEAPEEMYK